MGLTMKQWRLAKEFSKEQMAQKCGVHRNTYAAWKENSDNISVKNAKIIAGALNESVNTILGVGNPQNVEVYSKEVKQMFKGRADGTRSARVIQVIETKAEKVARENG